MLYSSSTFNKKRMFITIKKFIGAKSFGGIILFLSAIIAMYLANSKYSNYYFELLNLPFIAGIPNFSLSMDLKTWINDALMSIFFLLVGLEIKREFLIGELSSLKIAAFPIIGAIGGMLVPALIYIAFNLNENIQGFGVPMATDIAFALAVLLLFGNKIPIALKLFLVTLAVTDDIGAVLVIALFYTKSINLTGLLLSFLIVIILIVLNKKDVKSLFLFLLLGFLLWNFLHLSGIHTSISGIILAFTIPITAAIKTSDFIRRMKIRLNYFEKMENSKHEKILSHKQVGILDVIGHTYDSVQSPLIRLEHNIIPISTFLVMPLFAFFNAGVQFSSISLSFFHPISLGIIFGLFVGKPLGIFLFVYIADYLKIAKKPETLSWKEIFGVSLLGGIGFTMSIFISSVGFSNQELIDLAKISVIIASLLSALCAIAWIYLVTRKRV